MDAKKVWQWRILHVKKYSRHPDPFYHSNRIGLDFNVASNTQKKLDLHLVTNGVILEICDFAKTVVNKRRLFLTTILENSFDLRLENEQQRTDFISRIDYKVKDLIRRPPEDKGEVFTLFDTSSKPECNSNNELNLASTEHKTESFLVEMVDTDDSEHEDKLRSSQATSNEYMKTESLSEEMDEAPGDDCEHQDELKCSGAQSAEELKEDVLPPLFPYCEQIGLSLDVGSKQSLDLGLLTKGVMLELVNFTRVLTSHYTTIVCDVLEHNFDLDLKCPKERCRVQFKISQLLKRKKQLSNMNPNFKNEPFSLQRCSFRRTKASALPILEAPQHHFKGVAKRGQSDLRNTQEKRALLTTSERMNKRCRKEVSKDMETDSLSHYTDLCTSRATEGDHCHTFPLEESDLDSDICNVYVEQEEMGRDNNYTCSSGVSDLYSDDVTDSGDEEQTRAPRNVANENDMEHEEMKTKNMWKLRANRVKQILSTFGPFYWYKRLGLEFNVGFGPKQNIDVDSLPNSALLEVAKFALAMNSSQQHFIIEILEYNFDFYFQSEHQKNIFACEIMNRVRQLKDCEDAVKISKEVFKLPDLMPSINLADQSVGTVNHELSSILRMDECDVAPVDSLHSPAETKEGIPQEILDLYPFCREIGLKLHGNQCQQNKKLDINKLTNGAMIEVTNFTEKLCGTFEQICLDILRHNLDLDLQSGDSDLARSIVARIPAVVERNNLSTSVREFKTMRCERQDSLTKAKMCCYNEQTLDNGSSQATVKGQDLGSFTDIEHQDELNLKLWKLRANHIQHILSIPHEEHCPLYSYSRCKKLGIDFNVGSGVKQNLDPKLLSNGIMVEIMTFAIALLSAQRYFITEILEYNFRLDFNDDLNRSAFAQQTLDKIRRMVAHKKSPRRMKMPFELPDVTCTQGSTLGKSAYCPKCYQDRKHKLLQDKSNTGHVHHSHPHTMTDTVSADANCTAQKPAKDPSSTFSKIEETIMDNYPLCKKIGLNLFVDKDQPKDKLDTHILTVGIMVEVAHFARKLCAKKNRISHAVLEHNFNISMQRGDSYFSQLFCKTTTVKDVHTAWFSEVFVITPFSQRQPGHASKLDEASPMQRSEVKETINKRKLALLTKKRTLLPSHNISVVKAKTHPQSKGNSFPIFTEIGLDLQMTSKSREKEKLDLKLLTRAVCDIEEEEMGTENNFTCPLGVSDLDSDDITDSGGEEQTHTPRKAANECDMEQEEMGTDNMWKLRANRVKQILSTLKFGPFGHSERAGFEYNVGFGPKQNNPFDSLHGYVLLEVAKFALAMNSSQQHFIMEILEYNFDFYLHSEQQKDVFACEILNRVRQLKDYEDAVKISKDIFELPVPMSSINMVNQSMGSVSPKVSGVSRMEECDVAPVDPPHSPAEAKEHVSQIIVGLYPFCRDISLKLQVNQHKQNKKLDINKLTNGAMIEVTNFAEKLCGTYEQICLDLLGHNLDLDLQSGDSDLARSILARIPVLMERQNLSTCLMVYKKIHNKRTDCFKKPKLDFQNNQNLDSCGAGSSQAVIIDQDVGSPTDIEHQDELNLKLWKLRANHIQQILSIPHEEHCPLYSYSRCKKLGIDFNVGSGVKHDRDPRLLTNGIMVEIGTFAIALLSAQRYFITEILEYNFHLDFIDELHRIAFAQQTMDKIRLVVHKKFSAPRMKMLFRLPDVTCPQDLRNQKTLYCPKCYQDRKHKLCQDESDHSRMLRSCPPPMTNEVSADANCTTQKPAKDLCLTFSTIEKMLMDSYPLCKKIGLNLCVNKDQPKDKLDTHVLTCGLMVEVANFARQLCATKSKIIHAVLEHNFNVDMQKRDVDITQLFRTATALKDDGLAWFNEVFVIQPPPQRQPGHASKLDEAAAMQISEMKEAIKKRKLAMQTKEERATLQSHHTSVIKKTSNRGKVPVNCYPICTEIGLDLDATSKSGEKEKLDLKLLTRAVVFEIYKFATKKTGHYWPHTVFDILDYNFDLSSQHHRCWEFSIATSSKVQTMLKQYRKDRYGADEIFELPFVSAPKKRQQKKPEKYSQEELYAKTNDSNVVRQVRYHSDASRVHFLDGVKNNEEAWCHDEDTNFSTDAGTMVQIKGSLENVGCGSPLQENLHIKEEENDPHYGNMKPEPDTEEKYHPHYDDIKTEPNTEDIKHLVPGEPSGPLGYTLLPLWPNPERQEAVSENQNVQYYILAEPHGSAACPNTASNIKTEWDTGGVQYFVPVEAAGSQEYSMVIIGQDNESTLIKEEQENVPVGLHHC